MNPNSITPTEYPDILPRDLRAMMTVASKDALRYILSGVLVHHDETKVQLVATDGKRMAVFDCGWRLPEQRQDFIIPGVLIKSIPSWRTCLLSFNGRDISFTDGSLTVSSPAVEGNYPTWGNIIPNPLPTEFPAHAVCLNAPLLMGLFQLVEKLAPKSGMKITAKTASEGEPIFVKAGGLTSVLMPMRME